jgi:hypothetical protein
MVEIAFNTQAQGDMVQAAVALVRHASLRMVQRCSHRPQVLPPFVMA